ncbi:arginine--tRNA ligase [Nanoarchaeota archaeon]
MFRKEVAAAISKYVPLKKDEVLAVLEKPRYSNLGDIAFPCFILSKKLKKNPVEIANNLSKEFLIMPEGIIKIIPLGAYVNFFIDKKLMGKEVIENIQKKKKKYGSFPVGKEKTIVMDSSHPNIAKPMSIGHLRSTIIGNSLYKILSFMGYKVVRMNHFGDYGTQFGKLLVAYKKWGKPLEKDMKKDPIKTMLKLYVRFTEEAEKDEKLQDEAREMFKLLELNDPWALKLWKKFRELSLNEFKSFYKILGVDYDVYGGESFYRKRARAVVEDLKKRKIAKESMKAWIIPHKEYDSPFIIEKSDGTTLYSTRDLAAANDWHNKFKFDKLLYVVASEQNLYFKQLFSSLKVMGYKWAKDCQHVSFGMIYLPGKKMSTRKGNVVFLEDVLEKTFKLTREVIKDAKYPKAEKEKIAKAVGISALVYGDLSNDRVKDIKFDWSVLLRLEGDSGPYIQYTYARAKSILRNLKAKDGIFNPSELTPEEEALIVQLSEFPSKVQEASEKFMPNLIANYIADLADLFNSFYEKCPVMKAEKQTKETRAALTASTAQVLHTGMSLLGMIPLERM